MQLTQSVKSYFENNLDILETDFNTFIDDFPSYVPVREGKASCKAFFYIMQDVLGKLTDLDDRITKCQAKLFSECLKIETHRDVGGCSAGIYLNSKDYLKNLQSITDYGTYMYLHIKVFEDTGVPSWLPPEYEYILIVNDPSRQTVTLKRNNVYSISVDLKNINMNLNLSDLYDDTKINQFISDYDDFCKNLYDAIHLCMRTIDWKEELHSKVIPDLISKMEKISEPIIPGLHFDLGMTSGNNQEVVITNKPEISKLKSLILKVPFDKDPSTVNYDVLLTKWANNLKRYKEMAVNTNVTVSAEELTSLLNSLGIETPQPPTIDFVSRSAKETAFTYKGVNMISNRDRSDKLIKDLQAEGIPVVAVYYLKDIKGIPELTIAIKNKTN